MNVNEARKLAEASEPTLSIFNKLQMMYVKWKIKVYASQGLDSVWVKFLSWKVAYYLVKDDGFKVYEPLPDFLYPGLGHDVSWIIEW